MTIRFTASRLLLATACGAALLSATMLSAPTASAACTGGNVADPITGVCWAQSQFGSGISGTGGGFKKFCRGETDISNASRPIE